MGSELLVRLALVFVVFCTTFFFATRRNPKVVIEKTWTLPVIALLYTVLSTSIVYLFIAKVLAIATFGRLGFALPFVVNLLLLVVTLELFDKRKWIRVDGLLTTLWLALLLTVAHTAALVGLSLFSR